MSLLTLHQNSINMTIENLIVIITALLLLSIYLFPTFYWIKILKNNNIKNKGYILISITLINLLTGWIWGISWIGLLIGAVYVDIKVLKE